MKTHHDRSADPLVRPDRRSERAPGLLIVSDVRLLREGLAALFGLDARFRVVAHVAGSDCTSEYLLSAAPDLILLDLAIPDRANAIARAREALRPATIFGIAAADPTPGSDREEPALAGYVSGDRSFEELVAGLRSALDGDAPRRVRVAPPSLAPARARSGALGLTGRELEIVRLIDRCRSNKEIALALEIAPSTVRNHVHNILGKLRVHRRAEAAAAYRNDRARPLVDRP